MLYKIWKHKSIYGLSIDTQAADFHSSGAGKLCLTSACRDLGSNGQFSCPVFIFVNENDRTGILTNLPKLSWPGELHAGCHSPMCLGAPLVQRSVIATEFCFGQTDTFFVVVCVCCVFLHSTTQFLLHLVAWPVQSMETRLVETKFAYLELILSTVGVLDLLVNIAMFMPSYPTSIQQHLFHAAEVMEEMVTCVEFHLSTNLYFRIHKPCIALRSKVLVNLISPGWPCSHTHPPLTECMIRPNISSWSEMWALQLWFCFRFSPSFAQMILAFCLSVHVRILVVHILCVLF